MPCSSGLLPVQNSRKQRTQHRRTTSRVGCTLRQSGVCLVSPKTHRASVLLPKQTHTKPQPSRSLRSWPDAAMPALPFSALTCCVLSAWRLIWRRALRIPAAWPLNRQVCKGLQADAALSHIVCVTATSPT
ncbi:uncharacterized protein BDV14DRAFT_180406 [Aspergillus stella-maris]|uniref:uncharacterized protein n=1 Tax=Aspergillus stella-maris TaxID=1810926 RepID=UPI003CCD2A85